MEFSFPPRESSDRGYSVCLFLTEVYGLINANLKRQALSDEILYSLDFHRVKLFPHLYYKHVENIPYEIICKIVVDILITGSRAISTPIVA